MRNKKFKSVTEIVIVPAYNRRYITSDTLINDWVEGKDFTIEFMTPPIPTGLYINIFDVRRYAPFTHVVYDHGGMNVVLRTGGNDDR